MHTHSGDHIDSVAAVELAPLVPPKNVEKYDRKEDAACMGLNVARGFSLTMIDMSRRDLSATKSDYTEDQQPRAPTIKFGSLKPTAYPTDLRVNVGGRANRYFGQKSKSVVPKKAMGK